MPKPQIVSFMEMQRTTQRKVVFINQDCVGEDGEPVRHHNLPYLYLGKTWWSQYLGSYPVLKITIEPAGDI